MIVRCPLFGRDDCDRAFDTSGEDPEAAISYILHHLQGWPHYRTHDEATTLLSLAEEVAP